ncbi:hypothetical protein BH11MYX3_BH11MYX3_05610 [soil metagenome]
MKGRLPSTSGPRKTAEQLTNAARELGRGTLTGTAFHLAALVFVELRMPHADGLTRVAVIPVFLCMLLLRFIGFFMTAADRGSLDQRLTVLAIGAVGANLVWGVRMVALLLQVGSGDDANMMSVILLALATGALTAFAQILWIQRAVLSALLLPVILAGGAGVGLGSLAVLHGLFLLYALTQGTVAHRKYWQSVHATESLRCHADAAQLAAIAAAETNLRLRTEIAHSAKIEIELREAQKLEAVGRLAAGIAHEINTPVQFVSDSCRFLGEGVEQLTGAIDDYRRIVSELGGGKLAAADAIVQTSRIDAKHDLTYLRDNLASSAVLALDGLARIANIVAATKEFAYPHRKDKALIDVNKAVESTLVLSNSQTKYVADVAVDLGTLPPLLCHPGELNQVILNFIVNAAQAIGSVVKDTGTRGLIRIKTWASADAVRISIGDTGNGIPADLLDKIFEPFFTTKPVGMGTGQGLAICRSSIVDKHGGTIDVRTELGIGTTFTICLPTSGA